MTTDTTHITKEGLLQAIEDFADTYPRLIIEDKSGKHIGFSITPRQWILARAAELSAQETPQQCAYGEFDGFKEICTKVATVNRRGYHLCKPCADRQLAAEIKADMEAEAFYDRQRVSAQDASPKDGWQRDAERYRKARKMRLRLDTDSIVPVRPDKFDAMVDAAPEPPYD